MVDDYFQIRVSLGKELQIILARQMNGLHLQMLQLLQLQRRKNIKN